MTKKKAVTNCPNCGRPITRLADGCVLGALIQVVRERGDASEAHVRKLHAGCDVDTFWNDVGAIVDRLEAGEYS